MEGDSTRDGTVERALRVAAAALRLVGAASTERELLQGLCALLVNEAGYRLAWVGLAEQAPERVVRPVAWTGDERYVRAAQVRWDETPRGAGPTGRAIREGRSIVGNVTDPSMAPWMDAACTCAYAASAAVPLRVSPAGHRAPEVIGALNVYAARTDAFDERELALLEDLVAAAGRGMEGFRARDASEHALAEARAARDQLRAILEASPDGIFVHASDGRMLDMNEAATRKHGMTREEVIRAAPEMLFGEPHSFDDALQHIHRALEVGSDDFEWRARRATGETIPTEVRLRRLPGFSGGVDEPALIAIVRDLTERKRFEAQLLVHARLETLSAFAGGVAHDFNNSLAAVLGAVELAMHELPEGDPVRAYLEDAVEATSRARGLTQQLLAFARGGASVPTVFALGPLLEQTARLVLAGSSLSFRVEVPEGLWRLRADRDQIAQVFHNLLLNAAQANGAGGEIVVRAENVVLDAEGERGVRVSVCDDGPGIRPEHVARLFEPFYTTKPEGTGLGLPTALAAVRRHGGDLTVESRVGEGTTMVVTLPGTDEELAQVERGERPRSRALRVLVLEDELLVLRITRRIIEQLGHEVVCAEEGAEALALLAREREAGRAIDVALLDLTVRGGLGALDILERLRGLAPRAVVVGMSGYSDVSPAQGGVDVFVAKPFGIERLEEVLREAGRGISMG